MRWFLMCLIFTPLSVFSSGEKFHGVFFCVLPNKWEVFAASLWWCWKGPGTVGGFVMPGTTKALLQLGLPLSRIPYFSRFLDPTAGSLWDASGSRSTPGREWRVGRVPSMLISAIPTEILGNRMEISLFCWVLGIDQPGMLWMNQVSFPGNAGARGWEIWKHQFPRLLFKYKKLEKKKFSVSGFQAELRIARQHLSVTLFSLKTKTQLKNSTKILKFPWNSQTRGMFSQCWCSRQFNF